MARNDTDRLDFLERHATAFFGMGRALTASSTNDPKWPPNVVTAARDRGLTVREALDEGIAAEPNWTG